MHPVILFPSYSSIAMVYMHNFYQEFVQKRQGRDLPEYKYPPTGAMTSPNPQHPVK